MRGNLLTSNYQKDLVFIGTDNPDIPKHEFVWFIEQEMDIESGRDFDGIEVEDMTPEHTNTRRDLQSYERLSDDYEFVYFVRLRPVR